MRADIKDLHLYFYDKWSFKKWALVYVPASPPASFTAVLKNDDHLIPQWLKEWRVRILG